MKLFFIYFLSPINGIESFPRLTFFQEKQSWTPQELSDEESSNESSLVDLESTDQHTLTSLSPIDLSSKFSKSVDSNSKTCFFPNIGDNNKARSKSNYETNAMDFDQDNMMKPKNFEFTKGMFLFCVFFLFKTALSRFFIYSFSYPCSKTDEYSTECLSDIDPFYLEMAQNVRRLKHQPKKKNRLSERLLAKDLNCSDHEPETDLFENEDVHFLMAAVSETDKQIEEKINECRVIS